MDSTRNPNLQSPLNESVSGGQAPPTFSPYFMNAHFFWEHTLYGHCVIPFRAVFHISLTGKYKGCSSISLYSKKKWKKKKKKEAKKFIFLWFSREPQTHGWMWSPSDYWFTTKDVYFLTETKYYVWHQYFLLGLCHPLYFFLYFLPESKRTLVRNCTDFHWTHQTHCNKHWSLEKTHSRFVLLHSEATLSLRKVSSRLIQN